MQQEKYDIQKEFENAGLFLDEVEFDNIERLQYANSLSKEDWARSYIRRKRPEDQRSSPCRSWGGIHARPCIC